MPQSLPLRLHLKVRSIPLATLHRMPLRELLKSARIAEIISFFEPLLLEQKRWLCRIS
jgi:hypothetical protein